MYKISHRGNLYGPNSDRENSPRYIEEAIASGFNVEVDLWYDPFAKQLRLGHDEGEHLIGVDFLIYNMNKLWIHCKDYNTLRFIKGISSECLQGMHYFYHEKDPFALTSRGDIWAYPTLWPAEGTIWVCPEMVTKEKYVQESIDTFNFAGICSDYVGNYHYPS